MLNNSLKIFYFILVTFFFYFILSTYFSKQNIYKTETKILDKKTKSQIQLNNLPIIKNDTDNVILYNSEEIFKKKVKKRKVWELLK